MSGILSSQALMWRDRAREVAEKYVRPNAAKYDKAQEYPWDIKDAIAEAGLLGVWIPKEYGGAGGGVLDLCVVRRGAVARLRRRGRALRGQRARLVPDPGRRHRRAEAPLAPADRDGREAHLLRPLREVRGQRRREPPRGRARSDGDHYVLNGEKKWNTNGGAADIYTVFAVTDPESQVAADLSALMVEKGMPGFKIGKVEDKMGIRCVPVVEIHFDDCRVPAQNLLGETPGMGFKHAMMTLDQARPGVAAQAVGPGAGRPRVRDGLRGVTASSSARRSRRSR